MRDGCSIRSSRRPCQSLKIALIPPCLFGSLVGQGPLDDQEPDRLLRADPFVRGDLHDDARHPFGDIWGIGHGYLVVSSTAVPISGAASNSGSRHHDSISGVTVAGPLRKGSETPLLLVDGSPPGPSIVPTRVRARGGSGQESTRPQSGQGGLRQRTLMRREGVSG